MGGVNACVGPVCGRRPACWPAWIEIAGKEAIFCVLMQSISIYIDSIKSQSRQSVVSLPIFFGPGRNGPRFFGEKVYRISLDISIDGSFLRLSRSRLRGERRQSPSAQNDIVHGVCAYMCNVENLKETPGSILEIRKILKPLPKRLSPQCEKEKAKIAVARI